MKIFLRTIGVISLLLFIAAGQAIVFAAKLAQSSGPTSTIHISSGGLRTAAPTTLHVGDSVTYSLDLQNLPAEGLTSAEFACRYDETIGTIDNFVDLDLFGTNAITALNGPAAGTFVYAIAGTTHRATVAGNAFTFDFEAIHAGSFTFTCQVRASKGGALFTVDFTPAVITVLEATTKGTVTGVVTAGKPITITLLLAGTPVATANPSSGSAFSISADPGTYTISASSSGFVKASGSAVLTLGTITTKNTIALLAGDIDGNNTVDDTDVLTIGMHYNQTSPTAADLNSDGIINVLDLQLLAANYPRVSTTPAPWLP